MTPSIPVNHIDTRTRELHTRSIIIQALDFTPEAKFTPAIYPALKASGVTALHLTVARPFYTLHEALESLSHYYTVIDDLGFQRLQIAAIADDIRRAKSLNHIAIILGLQNTTLIGDNLHLLTILARLGIRIIQLTYQNQNRVGSGCNAPIDHGLTPFGEHVVAEMNRLGLLIDLSHVGPHTSMEAIERSTAPCAFTHTCAHALFPHIRNKPDTQLQALADKGGVIGVAAYSPFYHQQQRPTLEDYLNQIEYLVDLVGSRHVGIGLDLVFDRDPAYHTAVKQRYPEVVTSYNWDTIYPVGLESITHVPRITSGLIMRGFSNRDVERIMGVNFLRLFARVWK